MTATRPGRRLAGAALASATLAFAVAAGVITAAAAQATLTLSPNHGRSGAPFSANFSLGSQCPSGSKVDFSWDGTTPLGSASVPDANTGSCTVSGVGLVVPAGQDPAQSHLVKATAADPGGSRLGSKSAPFTVEAAAGSSPTPVATPTSSPIRTPRPGSTPSASPTSAPAPTATPAPPTPAATPAATQTPLPILDIPSFAPHDCSNGIPETTACPTASDALAIAGSAFPPVPPLTASASGSHGGTSHTPLVLAAVVLLAGVSAVAGGWRAGTRTRRGLSRAGVAARGRPRGPRRSG